MNEKNTSIIFDSFEAYRKHLKKLLGMSVPFFMIVVVTIVLATVFPFSLIFTLPFLVIPFAFAYIVALTQIISDHPMAFNEYYRYILLGLSPFVRRLIHPFITLLKMLLLMLITTLAISLLANLLAPTMNPALANLLDDLAQLMASAVTMNELTAFIKTNEAIFAPLFNITMLVNSFVALVYLWVSFSQKLPALFLAVGLPNVFPQLDRIHQTVFRHHRATFALAFIKNQWISILVLTLGFIFGATLGWILDWSSLIITLLALLVAVSLWAILIPHYFLVLGSVYGLFEKHYVQEAQAEIVSFLHELDKINELNEEQKQAIREELNKHLNKPAASIDESKTVIDDKKSDPE